MARSRYSPEVRERAVRMVLEHVSEYSSQWAAIGSISAKIGCFASDVAVLSAAGGTGRGTATWANHQRAREAQGAQARESRAAPRQRDSAQASV